MENTGEYGYGYSEQVINMFRRQKNITPADNSLPDKVAGKIAGAWIRVQTKFSERMSKFFSKVPVKRLKILLVVFCLGCGGYSIYLVVNAIAGSGKKQPSFKVDQVNVPKHFDKTGDEMIRPENFVDEGTYQQVQEFKQYMDSLQIRDVNRYDSIMHARPGLMDSVLMLEEIYNSQKIK